MNGATSLQQIKLPKSIDGSLNITLPNVGKWKYTKGNGEVVDPYTDAFLPTGTDGGTMSWGSFVTVMMHTGFDDNDDITFDVSSDENYVLVKQDGNTIIRLWKSRVVPHSSFIVHLNGREVKLEDWNKWQNVTTVIAKCPVELQVYDKSGNLIQSLDNENEMSSITSDGHFYTIPEEGSNNLIKIAHINGSDFDLKLNGTDVGTMELTISTMSEDGSSTAFTQKNIPLTADTIIKTQTSSSATPPTLSIDTDGDGQEDSKLTLVPVTEDPEPPETTNTSEDTDNGELDAYNMWLSISKQLKTAVNGDAIAVDADTYTSVPQFVLDTIKANPNATLALKQKSKTTNLTSANIPANELGRLAWPIELLLGRLNTPSAATSLNPIRESSQTTSSEPESHLSSTSESIPELDTPSSQSDSVVEPSSKTDDNYSSSLSQPTHAATTTHSNFPTSPVFIIIIGIVLACVAMLYYLYRRKH